RATSFTSARSPPWRSQRRRVMKTAASSATTYASPYACTNNGPTCSPFDEGLGRKAGGVTKVSWSHRGSSPTPYRSRNYYNRRRQTEARSDLGERVADTRRARLSARHGGLH